MNWLLVHFVSGQSFFSGIALIWLAAWLGLKDSRTAGIFAGIFFVLGMTGVICATAPLSGWFYIPAGIVTLIWLCSFRNQSVSPTRRKQLAGLMTLAWLAGAILELPFQLAPSIPSVGGNRDLTIFGDSLTAGLNDGEPTWPKMLGESTNWKIHDHSFVGATTETGLKKIRSVDIPPGLVMIGLGGNDILGKGDVSAFEEHLDEILKTVSTPDHVVMMFELPLIPLRHQFGQVQRALAAKYNVTLIPKRILVSVLFSEDTTLDSIHLSEEGHRELVESVREMLGELKDDVRRRERQK